MERPELYELIQQNDVREAFRMAYCDIESAQNKLRAINPNNPLLKLIKLRENGEGLDFGSSFRPIIMEHSNLSPKNNLYYAIGVYVDLLEKESLNQKFF